MFTWNADRGIPDSCCKNNTCSSENIYAVGCTYYLKEYVETLNLWLLFANFPFVEVRNNYPSFYIAIHYFFHYRLFFFFRFDVLVVGEYMELFTNGSSAGSRCYL